MDALASASIEETPLKSRARQLLYRRMRVGITDGRVFIGNFHCLDKQGNILLVHTTEHRSKPGPTLESSPIVETRNLGMVLVPVEHRVSAEFELQPEEAAQGDFLNPDAIRNSKKSVPDDAHTAL
mmetsp:Transcript_9014/g.16924  ORF Transcript_9014/g.16924 Transcript_9014/m.16924 type:complete len:125 (+) Transcript_9014:123-497(+)|eukprot:CAMPEP_0114237572 /NCGR_PEP_ID=MMETSP0058-20121206/7463_1 /TAXON_ID=36894 /ORGANISM="Pyramimonas parkeae, CCMP726" /LENGTH=124 /DNA_ID=CAMNT_0001349625 /DNA_START=94 /DNA_END=468 /DNA_ORIENTATION=+